MLVTAVHKNGPSEDFNVQVGLYSDNTPFVKPLDALKSRAERFIVHLDSMSQFDAAMMLGQTIKHYGLEAKLYMPYAFGARQDRINPAGDMGFAAKYYAGIINSMQFDEVLIADPHSPVISGMIDNCSVVSAGYILASAMNKQITTWYDGVIAPDAGATGRAYDAAAFLGIPNVYQAWKHRDVSNGKITGFGIEPIPAGYYLMVDDICDGGGTFNGLASILPEGVECDLYVTHGIFSNGLRDLKKNFKKIITTDSVPHYEIPDIDIKLRSIFNV